MAYISSLSSSVTVIGDEMLDLAELVAISLLRWRESVVFREDEWCAGWELWLAEAKGGIW